MAGHRFWVAAKALTGIIAFAAGLTLTPAAIIQIPFIRVIPAAAVAAVAVFIVDVGRVLNGDTHEFEVPFLQVAVVTLGLIVVISVRGFVDDVREVIR